MPVDIRRFPWIKPFVADYAFEYAKVAPFFSGNPDDANAWREAIARTSAHRRPLNNIADVIQAQQQRRGAPAAAMDAGVLLRDPKTVAIVTGQQAGLFGGPLFTLLKAVTAIQLADHVRREHNVPAIAVFWIDAEDHDWDEVKACGVLDAELAPQVVDLGNPPGAHAGPVARVTLDASIETALARLASLLPQTEFTASVLDDLRAAYRPGTGMADAFGRWMEAVLGRRGLVVFNAADPAAKPLAADVFQREIERAGDTARRAAAAGDAMEARGYHAQVTPQPGTVALFHMNSSREPIRMQSGDTLSVGERTESKAALLARAKQAPHEFSPNVLLRPIVQDTLFPTACYVAGPNELVYLGQLRGIYEAFGVPMPLICQRATATLLDSNAARFLVRHEVPLEVLRAQDEAALNALLEAQLPPGVDASLTDVTQQLEERMDQLAAIVKPIDATLEGAARSALGRMQDDLGKLRGKIIQAAKKKDETLRRQFHHAQAQAFPGGEPQERAIGFVSFLNKYGPALVDRLLEELPPDMGTHWVITP